MVLYAPLVSVQVHPTVERTQGLAEAVPPKLVQASWTDFTTVATGTDGEYSSKHCPAMVQLATRVLAFAPWQVPVPVLVLVLVSVLVPLLSLPLLPQSIDVRARANPRINSLFMVDCFLSARAVPLDIKQPTLSWQTAPII